MSWACMSPMIDSVTGSLALPPQVPDCFPSVTSSVKLCRSLMAKEGSRDAWLIAVSMLVTHGPSGKNGSFAPSALVKTSWIAASFAGPTGTVMGPSWRQLSPSRSGNMESPKRI
jgi:hypothetical protein